jgi:pimeloyl-ACP methyl ester carboxylesterase
MHDGPLAGFERFAVDGVRIAGRSAGSGPPVLLLHGYPQRSHRSWLSAAPSCWLGLPVSL